MTPDPRLPAAVESLWRLMPPAPSFLMSTPEFAALADACEAIYGGGKARFAPFFQDPKRQRGERHRESHDQNQRI